MNTRLLDIGQTVTHACLAGVVLLPWLLFEAAAAPSGAGYRETVIAQVPAGETSNLVDRLLISEGAYNKTGAGTLALAVSNLMLQGDGRLVVREGPCVFRATRACPSRRRPVRCRSSQMPPFG